MSYRPKLSDADKAQAAVMHRHGYTCRAIAAHFNVSNTTIERLFKPERVRVKAISHATQSVVPWDKGLWIPPGVLIERDRARDLEPRSLTAALMGDPLPGRSALERAI
jgi:hypothetical protein